MKLQAAQFCHNFSFSIQNIIFFTFQSNPSKFRTLQRRFFSFGRTK